MERKQRAVAVWLDGRNATLDHLPRDLRTYHASATGAAKRFSAELTANQPQGWVNRRILSVQDEGLQDVNDYAWRSSASQKVSTFEYDLWRCLNGCGGILPGGRSEQMKEFNFPIYRGWCTCE